jgi:hypothetical protein
VSEQEEQERLARVAETLDRNVTRLREEVETLSDEELIAQLIPTPDHITAPMEMQRRLITATRELRTSLDSFAASSRRAAWSLIGFTVILVALTVVLIVKG